MNRRPHCFASLFICSLPRFHPPSTFYFFFSLWKRNLRQTVKYIKDHFKKEKKRLKRADFLLRAAATVKLWPSPHAPGATVTVSPSKGPVRRVTTALKNIKSSDDPISWGEIWRRISLIWPSDVCLLTPVDWHWDRRLREAGQLYPLLWSWTVTFIPKPPSTNFLFKAPSYSSVFQAFSVVTLVNLHREQPCEGFSLSLLRC